ncbi:MAG: hypothetical protein LBU38_03125 [Propionibacteriaceae bacterium]|nr:hypothetical protein [Propionibacteriaceae bacterium]
MTAGRSAVAQDEIRQTLDSAGSRVLDIRSKGVQGFFPQAAVSQINALNAVATAVGLATARDMVSGHRGSDRGIPLWVVYGNVADMAELVSGRWPRPGEAIVADQSKRILGIAGPAGFLVENGAEFPIVGTFRAVEPFTEFGAGALTVADSDSAGAVRLLVLATDHSQSGWVEDQVMQIISVSDRSQLEVISPASLAELQAQVNTGFVAYARQLFAIVLFIGVGIIAVVVLADILLLRSDLGRRRALGATRGAVAALVVLRTFFPAFAGVVLGDALGLGLGIGQLWPSAEFAVALAALCLLCVIVASAIPAFVAVSQDPVKALRTP